MIRNIVTDFKGWQAWKVFAQRFIEVESNRQSVVGLLGKQMSFLATLLGVTVSGLLRRFNSTLPTEYYRLSSCVRVTALLLT